MAVAGHHTDEGGCADDSHQKVRGAAKGGDVAGWAAPVCLPAWRGWLRCLAPVPRRPRAADGRRSHRRGTRRGRVIRMRVLVIEDHEELADVLARGLRRGGMAVDVALDGGEGWFKLGVSDYDVVVLDRDLPVLHGDELCRRLRAQGAGIRVLMLTAAGGPDRAAEGLGLGADDYLAKPFDFVELSARVRALARRPALAQPPVLEAASIRLDSANRSGSRVGRPLELTRQEVRVLEVLLG